MVSIGSKNGNDKNGEQSEGDGRRESVKSKTSTYQIKMIKPNPVTRFVDGRELKNVGLPVGKRFVCKKVSMEYGSYWVDLRSASATSIAHGRLAP